MQNCSAAPNDRSPRNSDEPSWTARYGDSHADESARYGDSHSHADELARYGDSDSHADGSAGRGDSDSHADGLKILPSSQG